MLRRLLPFVLAAGCYSPGYGNGDLQCGPAGECPSGYVCSSDNHCYPEGQVPEDGGDDRDGSGGRDGAGIDGDRPDADPGRPVVTIDLVEPSAAVTNQTDLKVEFSADRPASFTCAIDDEGPTACTSPMTWGGLSGDGLTGTAHTISIVATANNGMASEPATYHWTVDTTGPTAVIQERRPLTGASNIDLAEFVLGADESATFECNLDAQGWLACDSVVRHSGLAMGPHSFSARAVDPAGNLGLETAPVAWVVTDAPLLQHAFERTLWDSGAAPGYDAVAGATLPVFALDGFAHSIKFAPGDPGSRVTLPRIKDFLTQRASATISFWFNEHAPYTNPSLPVVLFDNTGIAGIRIAHLAGSSALSVCAKTELADLGCQDLPSYNTGEWHHLLLSFDPQQGLAFLEVYFDGALAGSFTEPSTGATLFTASASDAVLGPGSGFMVDDFRVYDRTFDEPSRCEAVRGWTWSRFLTCMKPLLILGYDFEQSTVNTGSAGAVGQYDGVWSGTASYASGVKSGSYAAKFAGTNKITVTDTGSSITAPLSASNTGYTISYWWKQDTHRDSGSGGILDTLNYSGPGFGGINQTFPTTPTHYLRTSCRMTESDGDYTQAEPVGGYGIWHHSLMRYAGSGLGANEGAPLEVYADGTRVGVCAPGNTMPIFNQYQKDLTFGYDTNVALDEVRIYAGTFNDVQQCNAIIGGNWSFANSTCVLPLPAP